MQAQLPLLLSPFLLSRHRAKRSHAAPDFRQQCAVDMEGVPAEFTQAQAEWIVALHRLHRHEREDALGILRTWAPMRCSSAQAACIESLMKLDLEDFFATLADAMEQCELRDVLYDRAAALGADV